MSINILNTSRPFEVNSRIIEWDMKRAGPSLIKELGLLPMDEITKLEMLPKLECDVAIGKRQIKDKEFSARLEQAFTDIMNKFMDVNGIDRDLDVIAIKKDACFIINKKVSVNQFGKFIKFAQKNEYHAFMYIKPSFVSAPGMEFYFKRNGDIDIKGLVGDKKARERVMKLHEDGILNLLLYVIDLAEKSGLDPKQMNDFLHGFVEMYKRKELEFDYYREFNVESRFKYQYLGSTIMADRIDESMLEKVNIEYNYLHIILPLINLLT
jgi:hypothetical protein